jgi:hypothetical protein
VALQLVGYFIVFQDDGVFKYPLTAQPDVLPKGTWALTDSYEQNPQPCDTFQTASNLDIARIIQASSQAEESWKGWNARCSGHVFVMNYFSIDEMAALGYS